MVTSMQRADSTGGASQQLHDGLLVVAQADSSEMSLEDLVNLGQPEGKQASKDCNKKAPSVKDQPKGNAGCTIQESAGKIREKHAPEAMDKVQAQDKN